MDSKQLTSEQLHIIASCATTWIEQRRYTKLVSMNENRDKVANEVLDTEVIYVRNLEIMVHSYLLPLRCTQPPLLSFKHINTIFGVVEDILKVNRELLTSIQQHMDTWKTNKTLGDSFLKLAPYLKLYTQYCSSYDKAINKLKQKTVDSKDFATFQKKISLGCGQELSSLLIMPVQRIPRYKMLLQNLVQCTPVESNDYKVLESALQSVSEVADHINETIRERQNTDKILSIQKRFTGHVPPLLSPLRTFIREGTLTKVCRKESKKRWFILFSDALLYGTKTEAVGNPIYKFHRLLPLLNSRVVGVDDKDSKYKFSFHFIHTTKSFTVFAESEAEKQVWVKAIESQLKFLSRNEGSLARMGRQYSNMSIVKSDDESDITTAPVWIPDSEANQCMECAVKFTAIRRRHHCRRCGNVVCGKCSDQTYKLDNLNKEARVCKSCYTYVSVVMASRTNSGYLTLSRSPGASSENLMKDLAAAGESTKAVAKSAETTEAKDLTSNASSASIDENKKGSLTNTQSASLVRSQELSPPSTPQPSSSSPLSSPPGSPVSANNKLSSTSSTSSSSSDTPTKSDEASGDGEMTTPTKPVSKGPPTNSLLAFCTKVLQASPNVEPASGKKGTFSPRKELSSTSLLGTPPRSDSPSTVATASNEPATVVEAPAQPTPSTLSSTTSPDSETVTETPVIKVDEPVQASAPMTPPQQDDDDDDDDIAKLSISNTHDWDVCSASTTCPSTSSSSSSIQNMSLSSSSNFISLSSSTAISTVITLETTVIVEEQYQPQQQAPVIKEVAVTPDISVTIEAPPAETPAPHHEQPSTSTSSIVPSTEPLKTAASIDVAVDTNSNSNAISNSNTNTPGSPSASNKTLPTPPPKPPTRKPLPPLPAPPVNGPPRRKPPTPTQLAAATTTAVTSPDTSL
ncbi:hypothetical protein SAMD00019534_014030 [Acytostelium subglobosum LB1]|uniref:hypothetical protein n=1 Tax=Acytostelium subglobosum LB1 TaxID=1410327 RepID=UPI0006449BB3|nr:hypothetical protein SAMD00019534_014030 [Acytostelium subglobosum LB1]GAM18228.1 hypothetical protein SAMD00019534_014030 [Acytostelium subglobosum LB1]|eukprot:XP_012758824.1 hypothetical protein SAMD00019534_014030 [Acytostelium subglobosum LB1]